MKTFLLSSLLGVTALAQGFYSWPNPTVGTLYTTNLTLWGTMSLNSYGGLSATSDGVFRLLNNAGSSGDRLGTGEPNASNAYLRFNGTTMQSRLGDNSGWGGFAAGNVQFNGTVLPATDNATDLGSGSFSFRDVYADGDVLVNGSVRHTNARLDFGSGTVAARTAASGNLTRFLFGTGNSSGPALSFSGTQIQSTDGVGTLSGFAAGTVDIGHASDTTLARSAAGIVTIEGARVATSATPDTLTYSGTDVTVTAGKGPLQRSLLTCTNDFTLKFDSLTATDGGTIYVAPAATNCTVTLPAYVFGLGARTLTITGGTGNTNYTKIAWENDVIGGTNRVSVNAANYY